jgi:hypothetical protein
MKGLQHAGKVPAECTIYMPTMRYISFRMTLLLPETTEIRWMGVLVKPGAKENKPPGQ